MARRLAPLLAELLPVTLGLQQSELQPAPLLAR
jgi:hypothetical protein